MKQTPLFEKHTALGARMVDFSGWQMPIQYPDGIVAEHLATRKHAGLFDVSHMGRFLICGSGRNAFLRHALTNDCDTLEVGQAHYTILANAQGGAIDDAFLYRPDEDRFLLVVNASNKDKDWRHLQAVCNDFSDVDLQDISEPMAMLAVQGPESEAMVQSLVTEGALPEPKRNAVCPLKLCGVDITAARTGYTGEPVCFELFIPAESAGNIWDKMISAGAKPVGLGARDTLRLEAGLPLYGHELGTGKDGNEIPIFAIPQARFAVSFDDKSRDFIGRDALGKQAAARQRYKTGDFSDTAALPKVIRQFRLLDKGIARDGAVVYDRGQSVGWVTSGTMVPYWPPATQSHAMRGEYSREAESGPLSREQEPLVERSREQEVSIGHRAIGLCMIEPHVSVSAEVEIEVRGRMLKALIAARNLENRNGNFTYALL